MDRDLNNSGSEADGPLEAAVNGVNGEANQGSDLSLAAEFSNEVGANIFRTEINISSTVQKVFHQKSSTVSHSDFPQKFQTDDTKDTDLERSSSSPRSILKTTSAIKRFSASTYSKESIVVGNIESSPSGCDVFVESPANSTEGKTVNDAEVFVFPEVSSDEKQEIEKGVTEVRKDGERGVSGNSKGLIQVNGFDRSDTTPPEDPEVYNWAEDQREKAPVPGKRTKRVAFAEDDTTSGAEAASEAAAQSRLAQSHSNIEQLQQNLSTRLRSSTVETLRSELPAASPEVNRRRREAFFFAEGTDPAVWRKSAEEAASEAQTEFQVVVSHSPKPENAVVVSAEIGVKQERASSLTVNDLPLDVKHSESKPTEEAAVTPPSKSDDNIPYADSFADDEADNDSSPCFSPPVTLTKREESTKETAVIDNHKPVPKPQKVSWTTQLIERLSEEKETKRTPPKKPPRLVRYPGQKDFEENGKVTARSVVSAKPPQSKPRTETVDIDRRRIEDSTVDDESEDSDSDAQETERLREKLKEELKSSTSYIIMPESSSKDTQPQTRKALPERGSGGNKTEPPPPKPKAASGSAFKRLLSPATNLFSSQRGDARRRSQSEDRSQGKILNFTPVKQQKTPTYYRNSANTKEDPQAMKPLLSKKTTLSSNHSRVKPISTSPPPMVETAFLSKHTDSPTKQNMYNSSKNKKSESSIFDDEQQQKKPLPPLPSRAKSLSPTRKSVELTSRNIPQTSMLVEERLESIRRSLTPTAAPSPIPNDDNHFVGRRQQRNYQSLPPVPSEPKRTNSKVQASPKNTATENVYANKEVIRSEKSAVDASKDPRINQNIHIQIPDEMYQYMAPKNAYYHSPPGLRGRNQLGIDASSVSSTSTIVSSVQDVRPHRQDIPSGRVSAPPGASPGWQATKITNEYGKPNVLPVPRQRLSDGSPGSNTKAGSPGGEPIYGQQQSKGLEPKRLSRQEIEALYWQTQLLREELAAQRRYLSGRGRQGSSSSLPGHYATPLARPQPVYGSHHRSRSASPGPYHGAAGQNQTYAHTRSMSLPRTGSQEVPQDDGNIFIRGSAHRNTIATMRTDQRSTPTIYEEVQQQTPPSEADSSAVLRRRHAKPSGGPNPIFKRGSLQSNSDEMDSSVPPPTAPKRVSFTPPDQRWPTRTGSAADPPTRQRDSGDSDVFLPNYVNLAEMRVAQGMERPYGMLVHTRPLPPTPSSNSTIYGVVLRKPQQVPQYTDRWPPNQAPSLANRWQQQQQFHSESESGSEAGEIQRILAKSGNSPRSKQEEEWGADGKPRGASGDPTGVGGGVGSRDEDLRRGGGGGGGGGGRPGRRDDPRRHTLSGADHHQHHSGPGGVLARSMDLEMSSKSQRRKSPLPRGYPPLPSTAMLFDDDPGIMSEVETSSTGFRRGGKQRSSLPVVRTPSKTLERPLGLVFLQYRSETKRALLPNEITSIDTVKALFVRSFPKQLTMEYLDSPHVKIYIHDSSKDMFYELEDLRSHLRDIRDRSVLRLFESTDMNGGVLPGAGVGVAAPPIWDQDQSYFSEPEFDSEYQHQHIHKSKASSKSSAAAPYYMTHSYPPGSTAATAATLPRGGPLLRAYSPAVVGPKQTDRLHSESGYMSSPERGGPRAYPSPYSAGGPGAYEDPYYSQYAPRSGSITPVIDEEARIRVEHMERQLANLTGLVQKALTQTPQVQQTSSATPREYLQVPPGSAPTTPGSGSGRDTTGYRNDKSVSFEKSVSFSDEPPDMNSPKQHSPQHTERDRHKPAPPPKPVSLSPGQYEGRHVYRADLQLTPEMYNQLRGLQKKAKDLRQEVRNLRRMSQAQAHSVRETIRDTFIKIRAMLLTGGDDAWSSVGDSDKLRLSREEDLYKQEMLRLEKDLTELESTVEELRGNVINRKTRVNMSDVENMALILSKSSKTVADLKVRFPSLQEGMKSLLSSEMEKVVREEKFLKEEPERLESALRRCKKLTGTLVTLKRLASVQEQRLPPSTTPDSRLSPTLGGGGGGDSDTPITPPAHGKANTIPARSIVASTTYSGGRDDDAVSRQRPENALDALLDELQTFARPPPPGNPNTSTSSTSTLGEIGRKGSVDSGTAVTASGITAGSTSSLRRLHSYPSSSDCGSSSSSPPAPQLSRLQVSGDLGNQKPPQISPKPPVPERNAELLSQLSSGRRVPPPPPPRTSSRSPLASPTSPSLPPRGQTGSSTLRRGAPGRSSLREPLRGSGGLLSVAPSDSEEQQIQGTFNPASNSSSCESVNSQEGVQSQNSQQRGRKELLEQRHQELLRKQRALQEQYARLQQLQRGTATAGLVIPAGNSNTLIPNTTTPDLLMLKKTGSESNLLAKMGLGAGLVATMSGSLTSLAPPIPQPRTSVAIQQASQVTQNTAGDGVTTTGTSTTTTATTTTSKIYETDIL